MHINKTIHIHIYTHIIYRGLMVDHVGIVKVQSCPDPLRRPGFAKKSFDSPLQLVDFRHTIVEASHSTDQVPKNPWPNYTI